VTAIAAPTSSGFRVYLKPETATTPAQANAWSWHVSWSALPATGGLKAEYIYDGDGKLVKTLAQRQNLAAGILPTGSSAVIHRIPTRRTHG
jgi:hypothetical protein